MKDLNLCTCLGATTSYASRDMCSLKGHLGERRSGVVAPCNRVAGCAGYSTVTAAHVLSVKGG